MFKTIKKIFGRKPKEKEPKEPKISIGQKIQNKASGALDFFKRKTEEIQNEFGNIRSKMSNLLETNYNLGLKHLEKGNISDAIFRFRFIKKFWPECYDAHYQLAYALVLNKRPYEAKKILLTLLAKKPNYDIKAQELLDQIAQGENRGEDK